MSGCGNVSFDSDNGWFSLIGGGLTMGRGQLIKWQGLQATITSPSAGNIEVYASDSFTMKTPRRRDGGVSSGKKILFKKSPKPPFKRGFKESPQQRLWGIENLMKTNNGNSGTVKIPYGKVGIGTTAPAEKLEVAGAIKVANTASQCTSSNAGVIKFESPNFFGCNGTDWVPLNNFN